jgi:uncharacterized protein (DUF433 family)
MPAATQYPHLTEDAHGVVRIGATRYKVSHLAAEHYSYGWTAEELLRQHPDLKPQEVYAALAYFYDNFDRMVEEMQAAADSAMELRREQTLTRDDLLRRHATQGP